MFQASPFSLHVWSCQSLGPANTKSAYTTSPFHLQTCHCNAFGRAPTSYKCFLPLHCWPVIRLLQRNLYYTASTFLLLQRLPFGLCRNPAINPKLKIYSRNLCIAETVKGPCGLCWRLPFLSRAIQRSCNISRALHPGQIAPLQLQSGNALCSNTRKSSGYTLWFNKCIVGDLIIV